MIQSRKPMLLKNKKITTATCSWDADDTKPKAYIKKYSTFKTNNTFYFWRKIKNQTFGRKRIKKTMISLITHFFYCERGNH